MSMFEALSPHAPRDDRTVAAEPGGEGAPLPEGTEEPDVIPGADESDGAEAQSRQDPPFRTPIAGDSVSAEKLADETRD